MHKRGTESHLFGPKLNLLVGLAHVDMALYEAQSHLLYTTN